MYTEKEETKMGGGERKRENDSVLFAGNKISHSSAASTLMRRVIQPVSIHNYSDYLHLN